MVDTADPLAGSYFVESLTDEVEAAGLGVHREDRRAGRRGRRHRGRLQQDEIEQAAYEYTKSIDDGERGHRRREQATSTTDGVEPEVFPIDPALQRQQAERLRTFRAERDDAAVTAALDDVRAAARGTQNLLPPMREALRRHATLGEVSDALREVFGVYHPGR